MYNWGLTLFILPAGLIGLYTAGETCTKKGMEMSVLLLDKQRERDVNSSIHQTGPRAQN